MPRKPRYFLPEVPTHIVQRGHNDGKVFFKDDDYHYYLTYLQKAAKRYQCAIHAYALVENQVRILATPSSADAISRMMQYLGRYYVAYVNSTYDNRGTIWDGRFRSCIVQNETKIVLETMRYVESTPVRFGFSAVPAEHRWSSHHANALGKTDHVLTPHRSYLTLGNDSETRRESYRDFYNQKIDKNTTSRICSAWRSGTPLGNDEFKRMIEKKLKIKLTNGKPGRPRKEQQNTSRLLSSYGELLRNYTFKIAKR